MPGGSSDLLWCPASPASAGSLHLHGGIFTTLVKIVECFSSGRVLAVDVE
jgi:hypothetical protein